MSSTMGVCAVLGLLLAGQAAPLRAAAAGPLPASDPAFVLVAPDRGFLGNEEIRDVFEPFAEGRNAALVFVTDDRTGATLDEALRALTAKGSRRLVVLPFFLSRADRRYARVESLLAERAAHLAVDWARPFGESYFAVEALADRLRAVREPGKTRVISGSNPRGPCWRRRPRSCDRRWKRRRAAPSARWSFPTTSAASSTE
jgi:hypothetical protein